MKELFRKIIGQSRLTKCITLLLAFMIVLGVLAVILNFSSIHQKNLLLLEVHSIQSNQKLSLGSLVQLQTQVDKLSQQINVAQQQNSPILTQLNQRLMTIQNNLNVLKSKLTEGSLQKQLTDNHQQEMHQIALLQKQLKQLKQRAAIPTHYLTSRTLPFYVVGLDEWNGEPQVTVKQAVYYDLMGQGDSRDGWTLINISMQANQVIFENSKHQHVKINF